MSAADFFSTYGPYAKRASSALGVPASVILGQWALESAYGTSTVFKNNNNLAGIKHVASSIDSGVSPSGYSKYRDLNQFTDDYIRVMNNGLYDDVKKAGSVEGAVFALGSSPWAETHYRDSNGLEGGNLLTVIKSNSLTQFDQVENKHPYGFDYTGILNGVKNMTPGELTIYAAVGACAMAAWWMFTKK
jgi:flagellum-specific peptidoglycan hydrolase FlgJ